MTHHERTTLADRCARCDGTPDAQALLAEARAQLEQARRERDEARQSSEYLHVRWTEAAARADGLEEQLADARLSAEQGVRVARDLEERLRAERAAGLELRASLVEAATFARGVVGRCDCLTCAPSQQLAERWERQARGTDYVRSTLTAASDQCSSCGAGIEETRLWGHRRGCRG